MSVVSHWLHVKMKIMTGDCAEVVKTSLGGERQPPRPVGLRLSSTHLVCVVYRQIPADEALGANRHCCNVTIVGRGETGDVGRDVVRCHFFCFSFVLVNQMQRTPVRCKLVYEGHYVI